MDVLLVFAFALQGGAWSAIGAGRPRRHSSFVSAFFGLLLMASRRRFRFAGAMLLLTEEFRQMLAALRKISSMFAAALTCQASDGLSAAHDEDGIDTRCKLQIASCES
ncbi:hypothetical protein PQR62_23545 [Herbaspirillum lusitanum]|uniref:Secreted protein n=1 Tax=Herbaspirillum lusitanum TaxID=213312 RepID=A0ABW9AGV5_9BURK